MMAETPSPQEARDLGLVRLVVGVARVAVVDVDLDAEVSVVDLLRRRSPTPASSGGPRNARLPVCGSCRTDLQGQVAFRLLICPRRRFLLNLRIR